MTLRELSPSAASSDAASPAAALRDLAYALARPIRRWYRYRAMVARLERLDEHLLCDVGVPAWEIAEFARRVVDGKLPARGTASGAFLAFVRAIRHNARLARQRRMLIQDLRSLDDRILRDIGISRYQVPSVVDSLLSPWNERYSAGVAIDAARPPAVAAETPPAGAGTANDNRLLKAS